MIPSQHPEFTKKLKDQEVNEGANVTLNVAATGEPKPKVQWYVDYVYKTYRGIYEYPESLRRPLCVNIFCS